MIQVVVGVGVIEAFRKSVNKDARIGSLKLDCWVGSVVMVNGQESIADGEMMLGVMIAHTIWPSRCVCRWRIVALRLDLITAIKEMITDDRVNLHASEEASSCLESPEDEQSEGGADGGVYTILDGAENGDENTGKEDDDLEWRNPPETVDDSRRGDQITDSVDDDRGKGSVGDVEEYGR